MRLEVTVPHDIYNLDRNWFRDVIQELGGRITIRYPEKEGQKFQVLFFCDQDFVNDNLIQRYPLLTFEVC